jgi:hypothetical protein
VSRTRFLPLPVTPAAPGWAALARLGTPAPAPQAAARWIPLVRLACTLAAGQGSVLASAVLARVTRPGQQVGTVVLDLGTGACIDDQAREALCSLRAALRRQGTSLRLVIASPSVRAALSTAGPAGRISPDMLHPTLRAAVLATYAGLPGPGLATAQVRAALAMPAEQLASPAVDGARRTASLVN